MVQNLDIYAIIQIYIKLMNMFFTKLEHQSDIREMLCTRNVVGNSVHTSKTAYSKDDTSFKLFCS